MFEALKLVKDGIVDSKPARWVKENKDSLIFYFSGVAMGLGVAYLNSKLNSNTEDTGVIHISASNPDGTPDIEFADAFQDWWNFDAGNHQSVEGGVLYCTNSPSAALKTVTEAIQTGEENGAELYMCAIMPER